MTVKNFISTLTIQKAAAIIVALGIIITTVVAGIKKVKYYVVGIEEAVNANQDRDALLNAFYVLNGVTSSMMFKVDIDDEYYIIEDKEEIDVILRETIQDDIYVFVPHESFGEMPYIVAYNNDRAHYFFVDFEGTYTPVLHRNKED